MEIQVIQYFNTNDITSVTYLNSVTMKEKTLKYSKSAYINKTIESGWTYISFPTTMTVCESSVQGILQNICNQEYNLDTIFENDEIEYLLRYDGDWVYWDKTSKINEFYQMDKFSAVSSTEGLLVKSKKQITIKLPYDIYNNEENSCFLSSSDDGWLLGSVNDTKNVEDINDKIKQKGKTLKYILLFKDDIWSVYAPTNNTRVSDTLPRIEVISPHDSFWVFVE